MSPGSLNEVSSVVFVALTFALLGFCISGIFGFAMQCIFHNLHYSRFIFVFSSTFLLQCVLGDSSLITYQLLC